MKRWMGVVVAVAMAAANAVASPPPKPARTPVGVASVAGQPTSDEKKQLDDLDTELVQLEANRASLPALKIARQLVELEKKIYGDDSPQVRNRKNTMATLLTASGNLNGAYAIYKENLDAAERTDPESRGVQSSLMALSGALWTMKKLEEAEPYIQRALALTKKLDGEKSSTYIAELTTYAAYLQSHNEYAAAQRIYEQALTLSESMAKSDVDPGLLSALENLASIYWQTNQRPRAIALYNRVIASANAMPDAQIGTKASTMWVAAMQYHYGGREDLAKPLITKIIDLYTKDIARLEKDKPDDPMLTVDIVMLAFNYRNLGDFANAGAMFEKAIARDVKKQGLSAYLGSLAEVLRAQGHPKEALAMFEQAQKNTMKLSLQAGRGYDTSIADLLRELGQYKRAEKLYLDYRGYAEKLYGKHHSMTTAINYQLSFAYMAEGNIAKAVQVLGDALELAEHELINVLRTGTETDHSIYFARNGYLLDAVINLDVALAPKDPAATRLGLLTLLRRKGRVLDAAASSMATIRSKLSPEDKKLLDALATARTQLAALTVAGPIATGPEDFTKSVAALEEQIQKLELEVSKKSTAYRASSLPIELGAIQKLIPRQTRLVEMVNYQPNSPTQSYKINSVMPPRRFAAYVLAATGDPVVVDLGPADAIDDAVEKFRKAVSNPKNIKVNDFGNALYKLTIGKLAPALGGAKELLLAPDGTLNVVPFSALVDDNQKMLLQSYTFTYLTSGRDLLRLSIKNKAQSGGVIFADPAFDATGATKSDGSRGARAADLSNLSWPQLPGTAQEADEVEKTFTGLTEYRGAKATEGAVKALHGPRILHLATHGFFLSDESEEKSRGAAKATTQAGTIGGGNALPQGGTENPLLRSGLAFAGANKLVSGTEDGILTSMEASGLDLWGTKLVVLSACDTGNGKVTNGEGVYGLRRALVIAGAEGLVMSLWQVDDVATRDLMAGYYARLKEGRPRSSALRDIQLEIAANPKYAHPYYWAAFVAAGDNSPITN